MASRQRLPGFGLITVRSRLLVLIVLSIVGLSTLGILGGVWMHRVTEAMHSVSQVNVPAMRYLSSLCAARLESILVVQEGGAWNVVEIDKASGCAADIPERVAGAADRLKVTADGVTGSVVAMVDGIRTRPALKVRRG